MIRSQEGLVSVSVALPHPSSPTEFCMIMLWRDLDAVRAFAGEDLDEAVVHPDEAHLLRETCVSHAGSEGVVGQRR